MNNRAILILIGLFSTALIFDFVFLKVNNSNNQPKEIIANPIVMRTIDGSIFSDSIYLANDTTGFEIEYSLNDTDILPTHFRIINYKKYRLLKHTHLNQDGKYATDIYNITEYIEDFKTACATLETLISRNGYEKTKCLDAKMGNYIIEMPSIGISKKYNLRTCKAKFIRLMFEDAFSPFLKEDLIIEERKKE